MSHALRYLDAGRVKLSSSAPQFVKPRHCYWCNKPLTGKAKKFCRPTEEWKRLYRYNYIEPVVSECYIHFSNYWYSRPAFVRATFIKDNFTCQECGLHPLREDKPWLPDISQLEADHIIPISKVGYTEMSNMQTLCKKCNRKKGTSLPPGAIIPDAVEKAPSEAIEFRMPSNPPLCGDEWLKTHLVDHTPEEIEAQTIEISCDDKRLSPISMANKRDAVKTTMRSLKGD